MSFTNQTLPYIKRHPALTALASILLASGVAFSIKGGSGTTTYIEKRTEVVTCTATGGLAKYAYCNWHEPSGNAGSGSTINSIYYSIGRSPKVIGVDFTIGSSATTSGAVITQLNNVQTASGLTMMYSTGSYVISEGQYLRAVTLTAPTSAHTASMMIEYTSRLTR